MDGLEQLASVKVFGHAGVAEIVLVDKTEVFDGVDAVPGVCCGGVCGEEVSANGKT
jgi:hypothetical protein